MDDNFNMSMRKFLKTVGVTSQQQIEEAVRAAREAGTLPEGPLTLSYRKTGKKVLWLFLFKLYVYVDQP